MQCSIESSASVSLPICMDYTRLGHPAVRADILTQDTGGLDRFYPRSIAEDDMGRIHVLHTQRSRVLVVSREGQMLFEYNLEPLDHFKPRGMCVRNNLVYITDLRYDRLYLFTTEGQLVSYVETSACVSRGTDRKRPRGVAADAENNVYVCFAEELRVFNCTLPVQQSFGRNTIGRPKDVQLHGGSILVLSWDPCPVVFCLSAGGQLLNRVALGTKYSSKPWYFEVDNYGNYVLVMTRDRVSFVEVRSQEGTIITSHRLVALERPRGLKLLKDKTVLAVASYGRINLSLF